MTRDFNKWLKTFRPCIADYGYYSDFGKICQNVDNIRIELNILNTLVGSKNIEEDFERIIKKYPETLRCIPILLAVRSNEISVTDADGEQKFSFNKMNYSIADYKKFMRNTKLFDLLQNHIVNNLVDYVTGVEKNSTYFKEMYIHEIQNKWNINLSAISNKSKMEKRFDFVIKTDNQIYLVETNFYSSGGSKLNETARSYKMIAQEVSTIDGVTFVWFTDGCGWNKAKNNLEETFDVLETIYNINELEQGVFEKIF